MSVGANQAFKNRETLAWSVLWVSLGVFCLLTATVILTVRWYVATAADSQEVRLTTMRGTVLVLESRQSDWIGAKEAMPLGEGSRIRTDGTAQALLTLFDGSAITLLPDSEIALVSSRKKRFDPETYSLILAQDRGRTLWTVSPLPKTGSTFEVWAPPVQGVVQLKGGRYSMEIKDDVLEVKVREEGEALVKSEGNIVTVGPRQRSVVRASQGASPVQSAARDLILNGDFSQGWTGWAIDNRDVFPNSPVGAITLETLEGRNTAIFSRTGSKGAHAETYMRQDLNLDVSVFLTLTLSLEFQLTEQSLSGGGYLGSEYPLLVRIYYRAEKGETMKVYGFYYQNEANNLTTNGIPVPRSQWISHTISDNLLKIFPPPLQILAVEITASGHDYGSLVRRIRLVGE